MKEVPLEVAAGELKISANALRMRLQRGTSPVKSHKNGGRVFFYSEEIEEFMRNGGWDTFGTEQ